MGPPFLPLTMSEACDVLRLISNPCSSRVHPNTYTNSGDGMTWLLFVHAVEQRLP
jgi:hypothetical protein